MKTSPVQALLLLISLICFSSTSCAVTEIAMSSDAGDYIGQGLNYDFTDSNGAFSINASSSSLLTINYTSTDNTNRFTYNFKAPVALGVQGYFNATRYPFQQATSPGLSVYGNGRGCNTLSGYFIVYELSIVNNVVQKAAIDFVQNCENSSPALRGSVRINSTIPMPNPLPTAYAGEDKTVLENTVAALDGSKSVDLDGSVTSYLWQQVSGPAVAIVDPNVAVTSFLVPDQLLQGGEDFEFKLTVMDNAGNSASDNVVIHGRSAADPYTQISMVSDSGDYIGGGKTYDLNQDNGSITKLVLSSLIHIVYSGGSDSFDFSFATPDVPEAGPYLDATRYPFQGPKSPGLDITGNSRGCNTVTGYFVILEMSVVNGTPDSLALDFEQHCEGGSSALHGSIRINSSIPVPNTLPVAYAGKNVSTGEGTAVSLDGSKSFDPDGSIASYSWQQTGGAAVILNDTSASSLDFTTPLKVPLGGSDLEFELTVTDNTGNSAKDKVVVHVFSKSDPRTYMIFNSQSGDYIGAGLNWYYSPENAVFSISQNSDNGISVYVSSDERWGLDFVSAGNAVLTKGVYANATGYPFQDITSNGLDISGDGRGCNQLTGQFEVLQLAYENNTPKSFSATFEQHCESNAAALLGEIYYNVTDPSVPVSDAGNDQAVAENTTVTLNGSGSHDTDGSVVSYLWTQISGPTVVLSSDSDIRPHFIAPPLGDHELSAVLVFKLLVEDNLGFMNASTVKVTETAANIAPVAGDLNIDVELNTPINIDMLPVTSDIDGTINAASIDITANPAHGSLIINSDGTVDYTPDASYLGTDSFDYTVADNDGAVSNAAAVNIAVKDSAISANNDSSNNPSTGSSSTGAIDYPFLFALLTINLLARLYRRRYELMSIY